jgi:predicted ester cyclase
MLQQYYNRLTAGRIHLYLNYLAIIILKGKRAMSMQQNKAIEYRMVAEALNKGNLGVVCLVSDFVYHGPDGMEIKGTDDYKKFLAGLRTAYPDIHVKIEDILAEGDLVATRTTCTFTFTGPAGAIVPTGKRVSMAGTILDRFKGDRLAETWEFYDRLDLYQQLGLIPQNRQSE